MCGPLEKKGLENMENEEHVSRSSDEIVLSFCFPLYRFIRRGHKVHAETKASPRASMASHVGIPKGSPREIASEEEEKKSAEQDTALVIANQEITEAKPKIQMAMRDGMTMILSMTMPHMRGALHRAETCPSSAQL